VFEDRVLRNIFGLSRDEVTGDGLHKFYSSLRINKVIKSKTMRLARHIARMRKRRNTYEILVGNSEWKRTIGIRRGKLENTKMNLRTLRLAGVDWIRLAQDKD
jgi:hypothetical protein